MDWTDDKVFRLIPLYENHPCLYNATDRHYYNRLAKPGAMQQIAADMETTGQESDSSRRYRRRRSEVTSAGQCLYARILQFQHTITNTNTSACYGFNYG